MQGFREFVDYYSDQDVVNLYLNSPDKQIREISKTTGKSIGEIYRILKGNFITPNRLAINHDSVRSFAETGLSVSQIADLTGYTPRNVRYILSK